MTEKLLTHLNWGFICGILFSAGIWGLIGVVIWWVA